MQRTHGSHRYISCASSHPGFAQPEDGQCCSGTLQSYIPLMYYYNRLSRFADEVRNEFRICSPDVRDACIHAAATAGVTSNKQKYPNTKRLAPQRGAEEEGARTKSNTRRVWHVFGKTTVQAGIHTCPPKRPSQWAQTAVTHVDDIRAPASPAAE